MNNEREIKPETPAKKELVYRYNDLEAKGVSAKSIKDCERAGLMQIGYGETETGQRLKLVRITEKGRALMKQFPGETDPALEQFKFKEGK